MKKLFFMLIFSSFFSSSAFCNDECSNIQINPKVTVLSSYNKLTIDKTKTKQEVTTLAKENNHLENGVFANGLSNTNIKFYIELKTSSIKTDNSKYCIIPDEVTVFLGFDSPIIYISKELQEGSCEYNIVLNHEKTHQQINKKILDFYLPLFKSASTTIIKNTKAFYTENISDNEKILQDYIAIYNQKLTPLVDFIKNEIITEQKKLDNPENYKYESLICS